MRFGKTLRDSIYPPWKDQYVDYAKLKHLLREDAAEGDDRPWTEDDENKFCEEILNVQLEKIASFQASTFKSLEQRANQAGEKLRELAPGDGEQKGQLTIGRIKELEEELDEITNETKELKKYSSVNYTAFLKIVKKHDRKRGNNYKIRPMVQLSLSKRPFNSEKAYSPLVNKLSTMYFAVRQQLDENQDSATGPSSEAQSETQNGETYTAYKFWVHPDNLLEVKTLILRRLPVLVYSDQSAKSLEAQGDPTLNSIYFDNQKFSLYTEKVDRQVNASSLRIRWYGQLNENPELVLEQKIINENGSSEEKRFTIKEKYIQSFIKGQYMMDKTVDKMEAKHMPKEKVDEFKKTVSDIKGFIKGNNLEPVLRANYTRTAFQKPLDDKVRISLDTQLAFIREDALDHDRPCRHPEQWHRSDVDNSSMVYPFPGVNQGEISRFPFAVLEIKVKEDANRKHPQWVEDLMASHLVYKQPRFSKFVHGVASLFEDHVNNLPLWLSQLETDIRKDPQDAFEEEEERKAKKAADELVVGSFLGSRQSTSHTAAISSPVGRSYLQDRITEEQSTGRRHQSKGKGGRSEETETSETAAAESRHFGGYGNLSSIFPSFSVSKYAQAQRKKSVVLPPGVTEPGQLIKDSGPLNVEPKVWLANERTFLKWQHISLLLGSLAIALFTAGGDFLAMFMGIAYIVIAAFTGLWGWLMHRKRRNMIVARSGKDFDNLIGPIIVSCALMIALILNFVFKYREAIDRFHTPEGNQTSSTVDTKWADPVNIELL
ncbi:hypothetical protein B7494_g146 [Chlorociboria aeruginascens]|nr:hypothetical protein B7494_g146 [Chlorociboria aeruginascens]